MKKNKKIMSIIFGIVLIMVFSASSQILKVNAEVTLESSKIKDYVLSKEGQSYPNGQCLRFVEESYQNLGATRPYNCCATKSGNVYIRSTSSENIPIGATVYFGRCGGGPCRTCRSSYYGHVGIYIGDGKFVHATGGRVKKSTIRSWKSKYRGYGYCGNFTLKQKTTSPYEHPPIYNGVDYSSVYNYDYYIMNNNDIKKAYGNDRIAIFEHFINRGMLEGRRGSEYFDVQFYRAQNLDLQRAYGNDLSSYYLHYINRGRLEGRQGTETISNGVDYSPVYNYEDYTAYNPDIKRVYGNDRIATFQHFIGRGMLEGRRASKKFDVKYYRNNNWDLKRKYGDDMPSYYLHYINRGRLEERKGVE